MAAQRGWSIEETANKLLEVSAKAQERVRLRDEGYALITGQNAAAAGENRRTPDHARYYWLLLAENHFTRQLFGSMLRRIAALHDQQDRRAVDRKRFRC
jgi:hypothetical protein